MNTTVEQVKSVTLYFREGSSDKVYQCWIEPSGELFSAHFAYGRRGTTLQTGTKTSAPVVLETAERIYDKLVREKMAKGYTPGEDGSPYQHSETSEKVSGLLPQLLNPIAADEASRCVSDPAWCMQEKKDGRRLLLEKRRGAVRGLNRKGLVVGLSAATISQASKLGDDFVIDGEAVGLMFHAFDLLRWRGESLMALPYGERLERLKAALSRHDHPVLALIETAFFPMQKAILLKRLQAEKKEGVVFKQLDAPHTPGRPASGGAQLKYKFCATLSAVVAKLNPQRSVELRLLNGDGWVPAGNVTIPPNQALPSIGAVVEVRYLYAMPESGSLFQPVFLEPRADVAQHECVVSQLKYKAEDRL